ncbi:CPBP family intramembrane glutamic endopeptidase [Negadavirga shengliensis]|uniref:CPBP family intramembrane glutamic endopeptidase n=1 Tax=Negadavirga shengliensis TaxID=1389218 RepID=A0ABV9SXF3_9BACT
MLTAVAHLAISKTGNGNVSSLLIMWTPGIAAIIATIASKRDFREFGWKLSAKWMALGWLLPILIATLAYMLIWLLQLADVPNPTFLERARLTLGMDTQSDAPVIIMAFFYITLFNLIPAVILGLGEELGWRGFLVPELSKWTGFKKAGWISGIVWALWHFPGIISGGYGDSSAPLAYRIFCFSVLVVSAAIIFAWLRMKSGSIWPVAIFHATHNGVVQAFFGRITEDSGTSAYFTGEFGLMLPLITLVLAFFIYQKADESQGAKFHLG